MTLVLLAWSGVEEDLCWNPSSLSRLHNHTISEQAKDIDLYSASVEDLRASVLFLHLLEIKAMPRYTHHPVVEQRVFGHPTQSISENVDKIKSELEGKMMSCLHVPRRHHIILLIATKWRLVGWVMNLLTMFTAWDVRLSYCYVDKTPNQFPVDCGTKERSPILSPVFDIHFQWSIYQGCVFEVSLSNEVFCIFVLIEKETASEFMNL